MPELSQMVSEDSRSPMERLRRAQLWRVADAAGIKYPVGAPKTTMIDLLQAHGVDVTQPMAGIQWRMTHGTGSDGRPRQEIYPVVPAHASLRNGVNAEVVRDQVVSSREKKQDEAFKESRLKALEQDNESLKAENERLKEVIERRLSALEQEKAPAERKPIVQRDYWKTYRQAQGMGIPVKRTMKLDQIEELIRKAQA